MADMADHEAFKRFVEEHLSPEDGFAAIDRDALMRWIERNPDATPEEVRQVAMAPDHVLDTFQGEEES